MVEKFQDYFNKGFYYGNIADIEHDTEQFTAMVNTVKTAFLDKNNCTYQSVSSANLPHRIPGTEKQERLKIMKERNIDYISSSYTLNMSSEVQPCHSYFKEILTKFVLSMYGNLHESNIRHAGSFALYEHGDFLQQHTDRHTSAFCTIIVYLSDSAKYNGSGKLHIIDSNEKHDPIAGYYSLFELENHDVRHEIEPVRDDFERLSYLGFFYKENV